MIQTFPPKNIILPPESAPLAIKFNSNNPHNFIETLKMGRYSDFKEAAADIKRDKPMLMMARILLGIILVLAAVITYKAFYEPVNIFGIELNSDKIKHDTLVTVVRDTIRIPESKNSSSIKLRQDVKADVKSVDQKGGQTAGQIINN